MLNLRLEKTCLVFESFWCMQENSWVCKMVQLNLDNFYGNVALIPGTWSVWQVNFLWCHPIYVGPQYWLCFMSPFRHLEFCGAFKIFKKLSWSVLWSYNLHIPCHFFVPSEIVGMVLLLHKYIDSLYMILYFNDDVSEAFAHCNWIVKKWSKCLSCLGVWHHMKAGCFANMSKKKKCCLSFMG